MVLVANEVGLGLVPETPLGRRFRDAAGRLNQEIAALADRVVFVAAGLPLVLKEAESEAMRRVPGDGRSPAFSAPARRASCATCWRGRRGGGSPSSSTSSASSASTASCCSAAATRPARDDDIVELANGCLCCTVADDFLPTLTRLLDRAAPPEHILIETSGLALPKPLVQAFAWPEIRTRTTVDGVLTVIDAAALAAGRFADDPAAVARQRAADPALAHDNPLEEVFGDQLACADLVILNKTDLIGAGPSGGAAPRDSNAAASRGQGRRRPRRGGAAGGGARPRRRGRGRSRRAAVPARSRRRRTTTTISRALS